MQNNTKVLWEQYYHTTPLTFWEFVQEFKSLKSLFPCVENALKKFDKRSENLSTYPSEIYVQGAVGIGKGVYCSLIFLYRIYLFLLFVNGLGFLFTFSKMLSIAFLIVSFVLLLYLYLFKKKRMFSIIISSLFAFILPGLLMVSVYRNFLINLNFLVFITLLLICFVIFCI